MFEYPIWHHNNKVGRVVAEKQGMFIVLRCMCRVKDNNQYRILITDNSEKKDLGICYPVENGCGLTARIRCDRLNLENILFQLEDVELQNEVRIEILNAKPFLMLDKLDSATFYRSENKAYIIINQ